MCSLSPFCRRSLRAPKHHPRARRPLHRRPRLPPPPAAVVVAPPPPPAAAPAAPPAKTWKDLVTIEGLVDTYYQYNFTGTTSTTPRRPCVRQFDVNSNTFTLNYAKVGIGVNADTVGLRIDLGYGATGRIINAANPAGCAVAARPFVVAAGIRHHHAGHQPDPRLR